MAVNFEAPEAGEVIEANGVPTHVHDAGAGTPVLLLPSYSGNLDIMTAAAARVGEAMADRLQRQEAKA